MTKEEQLKIYSAYLPYGLKICTSYGNGKWNNPKKLTGADIDRISTRSSNVQYKPILYDLSYLTKEIEHEGERFVPLKVLGEFIFKEWFNRVFNWPLNDEEVKMFNITPWDTGKAFGVEFYYPDIERDDFETLSGIVLKQHNFNLNKEWVNDRGCLTLGFAGKLNPIHHVTFYGYPHYHSWLPFSIEHYSYLTKLHFNVFSLDESEYINKATLKN